MFHSNFSNIMGSSAANDIAGASSYAKNMFHGTKTRAFAAFVGTAVAAVPFFVLVFLALLSLLDFALLLVSVLLLASLRLTLKSNIVQCRWN